ncbi:redoxin domain-containing protein [Robiginitalea sp. IMCC43444]|uniref:redoxin domain-containing protein n=1 Tax=Robiginitalea sp. IMCC43444 TaxID=3459121 RepID=UPI0040413B8F
MRILTCCLLSVMLFSCNQDTGENYTLEGNLRGDIPEGTTAILRRITPQMQYEAVDTVQINEGSFLFKGTQVSPELHVVTLSGLRGGLMLVLEEGEIEVTAAVDSLNYAKIGGSPQNELLSQYREGRKSIDQRNASLSREFYTAQSQNDLVNMNALRDEANELQEDLREFNTTFVKEHPQAIISVSLLKEMLQNPRADLAQIQELYQGLDAAVKASEDAEVLKSQIENGLRTAVGSKAPDFSAPTPDGNELALSEALGKITLVDFWAAWCRPCRAENPNIVGVYQKYKDKGLKILGVSLDRNAEDWKKAIADDGLEWQHVSNVRYFDEIARLYNVNAIPASFILDENGVIIAKNLRGPELEAKIAELLP